ncbi:MAG: 3-hydroxybutyryl-CoA dehydrogenase [Proteobacteria bacterium]|nr:3-hydroxybutyryl-CoA dehydrogenase [Pseudomonadota bacterium]
MEFKKIGVVGAGQMGAGIAQVAAASGRPVIMSDINMDVVNKGRARIDKLCTKWVGKGKMTQEVADTINANLRVTDTLNDFKDVDIVIEAATENVDIKFDIFKQLDEICKPEAVLTSNTSTISITRMAAVTKRPERFVGMHFMNPVPVMKLVEMIRGLQSDEEVFQSVKKLAEDMGKTTAVANDFPGFNINRCLIPFLNEACHAYMQGVGTMEDIDTSIRLGLNHPMGPFRLADLIGLDTVKAIADVLYEGFGDPKFYPNALLVKYVEAGWLGDKTGRGFYNYEKK